MADQGRWFKLWITAPADDAIQALCPALRWAWAALGCYTKAHGTHGRVVVNGTNTVLAAEMGVPVEQLQDTISLLPHVHVDVHVHGGENRYGEFTVTFQNWMKYQEDSTVPQRMRALRAKKRRDKKRSTIPPTPLPGGSDPEGFSTPPVGSAGGARRVVTPEQRQTYLAAVEARRRESGHGDQPD